MSDDVGGRLAQLGRLVDLRVERARDMRPDAIARHLHALLSRLTEAIALLADRGADVRPLRLMIGEGAIEILQAQRKLVMLPPPATGDVPSVARIVAELVTFLLPLSEIAMQRIAQDLGDAAQWYLDPLVEVSRVDPTIMVDSRYATVENCAQRALYPPSMRDRCFVRRSVATQLTRVQAALHRQGYGLKLWDGYRPQTIQWQCVDPLIISNAAIRRLFVPPTHGSNHARGCAVDLTLVHRDTGRECAMPTGFDDPSPSAASDATDGLTREQVENRRRLHAAMADAGFVPLPHEWWHFNYRPDQRLEKARNAGDLYLVLDIPFDVLLLVGEPVG